MHRELRPSIHSNQQGRWGTYNLCRECQLCPKEDRSSSDWTAGRLPGGGVVLAVYSEGRAESEDGHLEEGKSKLKITGA